MKRSSRASTEVHARLEGITSAIPFADSDAGSIVAFLAGASGEECGAEKMAQFLREIVKPPLRGTSFGSRLAALHDGPPPQSYAALARAGELELHRLEGLSSAERAELQWNILLRAWREGVLEDLEELFRVVWRPMEYPSARDALDRVRTRRDAIVAFLLGRGACLSLCARLVRRFEDASLSFPLLCERLRADVDDFLRWEAQDGNGLAYAALRAQAAARFVRLQPLAPDTRKALRSLSAKARSTPYALPWSEAVEAMEAERSRALHRRYNRLVTTRAMGSSGDSEAADSRLAWEASLWISLVDFLNEGAFTCARAGAQEARTKSRGKVAGRAPLEVLDEAFDALAQGRALDACERFLKLTELSPHDALEGEAPSLGWFLLGLSGFLASFEKPLPASWAKKLQRVHEVLTYDDPLSSAIGFLLSCMNTGYEEAAFRRELGRLLERHTATRGRAAVQGATGARGYAWQLPLAQGNPHALLEVLMSLVSRALGQAALPALMQNDDSGDQALNETAYRWLRSLENPGLLKGEETSPFRALSPDTTALPAWLRQMAKVEEALGFDVDTKKGRSRASDRDAVQKPLLVWRVDVHEDSLRVVPLEKGFARGKPLAPKHVPLARLVQETGRSAYALEPADLEVLACARHGLPEGGWRKEWYIAWSDALPALCRHGALVVASRGGPRPLRMAEAKPTVAVCRRQGRLTFEIVAVGARSGWCWWWRSGSELAVARLDARAQRAFDVLRSVEVPASEATDQRLGVFLAKLGDVFNLALEEATSGSGAGIGGLSTEVRALPIALRVEEVSRGPDASFLVSTSVRIAGARPGEERVVAAGVPPRSFLSVGASGEAVWCARDLAAEEEALNLLKSFLREANLSYDDIRREALHGEQSPRADDSTEDSTEDEEERAAQAEEQTDGILAYEDDRDTMRATGFVFVLPSWAVLASFLTFVGVHRSLFTLEWPDKGKPLVSLFEDVDFKPPPEGSGRSVAEWFQPGERTAQALAAHGLSLRDLLEKVKARNDAFVVLEGGGVLALGEKVKALLDDLALVKTESPAAAFAIVQAHQEAFPHGARLENALVPEGLALGHVDALAPSLSATLRGYQREGIEWILSRWRRGVGCCLADDMGLGKTLQAIAALELVPCDAPALVVCPTSVVGNWQREVERFARARIPCVFPSSGRVEFLAALPRNAIVIVSYQTLQLNASAFDALAWSALVLDEAQMLKNADAKRTAAVAGLKARHKIALSGTPVENRIEEIHSLLDVLNPGIFGSAASFRRKFGGGASAEVAAGDRRALGRLLRPFLLRRTREQVLVDLPERTEETRLLSMTDAERMKYESYRDGAKRFLETRGLNAKTRFEAFTWLLRLRQACSHPRTLDATTSERSAKEQELLDLLAEVRERGQQALVFSQFLPTLEALHEAAVEAGHRAFLFVGETAREERDSLVARFQAGEADVLFMSLRAGGVGLNLTSADVVVHFDPWWNPALESQATARAHRFGRKDTVHVVRLCYSDTVEERMLELHAMKKQLSEDLLGGKSVQDGFSVEEADAGLSLDDIRGLFDDT